MRCMCEAKEDACEWHRERYVNKAIEAVWTACSACMYVHYVICMNDYRPITAQVRMRRNAFRTFCFLVCFYWVKVSVVVVFGAAAAISVPRAAQNNPETMTIERWQQQELSIHFYDAGSISIRRNQRCEHMTFYMPITSVSFSTLHHRRLHRLNWKKTRNIIGEESNHCLCVGISFVHFKTKRTISYTLHFWWQTVVNTYYSLHESKRGEKQ